MPGELSRFHESGLTHPEEPEYIENAEQEREEQKLRSALQQVGELYIASREFPQETRDVMERLCLAQQTVLEEQLQAIHPPSEPITRNDGTPYHHRDEALLHLDRAARELRSRDIHTIDISEEQ